MVRHPFFLAGLAVVILLGLTAGALVVIDSATGGSGGGTPTVVVDAITTNTVGPTSLTATAEGISGTAKDITTVRSAPGTRSPALGTLARNDDVVIDGRTTDSHWYRIIFPPRSELHGWIEAETVDVTGDPSGLAVATAEPPVFVEVPTTPPDVLTAVSQSQTPTEAPTTPETTPTVSDKLPDLAIGITPTVAGGKLFVTVINQGQGDATGDIVVAVFNEDGTKLLGGATLPEFTLESGKSIDIATGYVVEQNQTLLLIVDPNGEIEETDDTNNRATVAIAVGNPPDTPDVPDGAPPTEPAGTTRP